MLQHVVYTLPGKELVWMAGFTQSIKEERKIVMVVQLLYFHLDGGRKGGREGGRKGGREEGKEEGREEGRREEGGRKGGREERLIE